MKVICLLKEQIATMESDHKQAISILKNQLETSEQEIEQLKIRIEYFQQTILNNEKLTSNSDTSQIGIKNELNRDNTLAWSAYEHQEGEVNILSILFLDFFSRLLFYYIFLVY